jgi:AcrR family transcriptional regulator
VTGSQTGDSRRQPRPVGRRPVGRRPGDPERTRAEILAAARQLFGSLGFDRATIRAIAAEAGVDPALVIHHFSTKQQLFTAAHELPFVPGDVLGAVRQAPADQRGELLARFYLTVVAAADSPALSLIRTAATNEDAARMLREFVSSTLMGEASWLAPGPDGELRLVLAITQLMGLILARHIVGLDEVRAVELERLVAAVAPTIQRYLDGTDFP